MAIVLGFERGDRVSIGDVTFEIDGDGTRLIGPGGRVVAVCDRPADVAAGVSVSLDAAAAKRWSCWLAISFDGPLDVPIRRLRAGAAR